MKDRLQQAQQVLNSAIDVGQSDQFQQFRMNASEFLSARDRGETAGTRIDSMNVALNDVAETLNRSFPQHDKASGQFTNVISPVVVPKNSRSYLWILWVVALIALGVAGTVSTALAGRVLGGPALAIAFFGPHYWLLVLAFAGFSLWRNSYVMIPDGSQALITRFGKLEAVVGAGRTMLLNPWKRVSYIVNTTKEYPYNAPIREAPTSSRVNASVDLFLQFKIEDPAAFIFSLGGVNGFAQKLENAISEVTRALIYEQKADDIYDLVGEGTQPLLDTLNQQFLPAVRFTNANITHAEPSSQEYRMDLAAPEMIRVAKEAYTYQYELKLRKEQDEGELTKELAGLRETLSAIRAEIATSQARIDTAREKEIDRANAYARQMLTEAESTAKANSALLEAQALDLRAVSAATSPEIMQYRFQQDVLACLESVADHLPQVAHVGADGAERIDFLQIAKQMLGLHDEALYTDADIQAIRERTAEINARIQQRSGQIARLTAGERSRIYEGGAV
jgi:regulator of protease activity HflC (stomatin/prohibitin superfamily)